MARLNRKQLEAIYKLFNQFALEDQRTYYIRTIDRYRRAAITVTRLRAGFALLTGIAAAFVGLMVAVNPGQCVSGTPVGDCTGTQVLLFIALLVTVAAPAIGSAFTTLADLYQWDRMTALYESALENLDVADAQSPLEEMGDEIYRAAFLTYAEGTLEVMNDETAQWGQLTKPPQQLVQFVEEQEQKAQNAVTRTRRTASSSTQGTGSRSSGSDAETPVTPEIPPEPTSGG